MTDDMDIGALLITEAARRTKILDKAVSEALAIPYNDGYAQNMRLATAEMLADDLKMYCLDFRSSKWSVAPNHDARVASCQRWLDSTRAAT